MNLRCLYFSFPPEFIGHDSDSCLSLLLNTLSLFLDKSHLQQEYRKKLMDEGYWLNFALQSDYPQSQNTMHVSPFPRTKSS